MKFKGWTKRDKAQGQPQIMKQDKFQKLDQEG